MRQRPPHLPPVLVPRDAAPLWNRRVRNDDGAGRVRRSRQDPHLGVLPLLPGAAADRPRKGVLLLDVPAGHTSRFHGKGREASPPPPFSANPTRRPPRQEATPARRTHSFWQSHSPPASQPVSQSSAAFSTASKPRLYDDTSAVSRLHLGCVSAASPARAAPRPVLAARQHPKHAQPEAVLLRQRGGRGVDGVIGRR